MKGTAKEKSPPPGEEIGVTGRCHFCNWNENSKTKIKCNVCKYYICEEWLTFTCKSCAKPAQAMDKDDDEYLGVL